MTTPAPSVVQPGDVLLGKYRVERVLGRGGMGMVVAATHVGLSGLVAIKVMLPEMVDHPEAIGRFLREARAAGRLRGEHVARVHDVGTLENGVPYMVLEYLEGQDLDQELSSRGILGVGEAAAHVAQVCEALIEAHGQGIIHRDLKPANLFLTRRPNGSTCVKVLDFGISKDLTGSDNPNHKLTQTGSIMGSPHYMSPEQLIDSKSVDARCDVWALGVILYELVTATMPFSAATMPEVVAKVLSADPVPPSQLRPGIPPGFDELITRAIEKDRDKRFSSVHDFLQALLPFVNENEPRTSAPRLMMPSAPRLENSQSAVTWEHVTVPSLPPPAATTIPRSSGRMFVIGGVVAIVAVLGIAVLLVGGPKGRESKEHADSVSSSMMDTSSATSPPVMTPASGAGNSTASATASSSPSPSPSPTRAPLSTIVPRQTAPVTTPGKTKKKVKGFDE